VRINLPELSWQNEFVSRMDDLAAAARLAETQVDALHTELKSVLPS
jgi:hypothetical protein